MINEGGAYDNLEEEEEFDRNLVERLAIKCRGSSLASEWAGYRRRWKRREDSSFRKEHLSHAKRRESDIGVSVSGGIGILHALNALSQSSHTEKKGPGIAGYLISSCLALDMSWNAHGQAQQEENKHIGAAGYLISRAGALMPPVHSVVSKSSLS